MQHPSINSASVVIVIVSIAAVAIARVEISNIVGVVVVIIIIVGRENCWPRGGVHNAERLSVPVVTQVVDGAGAVGYVVFWVYVVN